MSTVRKLPRSFLDRLKILENSYLRETDPIRQSGFGGGPKRWRQEREPILNALGEDCELLDIGCANGYLLESLMKWGKERGIRISPHGLDYSAKLIEMARRRLPNYRSNFFVGNAWYWRPPRPFDYVYTVYDCVPPDYLKEYIHRLLSGYVSSTGRLIIGAYGSRSAKTPPFDIRLFLEMNDLIVCGYATGGEPHIANFVWLDKSEQEHSVQI